MTIAKNIAQIALEVGAIQINARKPFTWASGYKMPVYNDNRLLLGNARHRSLIAEGYRNLLKKGDLYMGASSLIELGGPSNNENKIVRVLEYKRNKMGTIGYFNGTELVEN